MKTGTGISGVENGLYTGVQKKELQLKQYSRSASWWFNANVHIEFELHSAETRTRSLFDVWKEWLKRATVALCVREANARAETPLVGGNR